MTADSQQQIQQLQQTVQNGPFYQELVRRFGKAESCKATLDGTMVKLKFAFHHEARLEAKVDSAIEYSEQSVEMHGLNHDTALELLKKGAGDAFGEQGCGIDWGKSTDEPAGKDPEMHAKVYRGTSCNCQARVVFRGKTVMTLLLSSSC